jgi:hypothetical protein
VAGCSVGKVSKAAVFGAPCFHVNEPSDPAIVNDTVSVLRAHLAAGGSSLNPAVVAHDQGVVAAIFQNCTTFGETTCNGLFAAPAYTPDGAGGELYAIELNNSSGDDSSRGVVFFFEGEHLLNGGPPLPPNGPALGSPPTLPGPTGTYTLAIPDAQVPTPGANPGGLCEVTHDGNGVFAAGLKRFTVNFEVSTPENLDGISTVIVANIGDAGIDPYTYEWNGTNVAVASGSLPPTPQVIGIDSTC